MSDNPFVYILVAIAVCSFLVDVNNIHKDIKDLNKEVREFKDIVTVKILVKNA